MSASPEKSLSQAAPGTRWDVVALVVLAGVIAGMQVGKVPPAIPVLRHDLQLDLVTAGWVASFFNVVGAAGGIVIGGLTDRLGARRILLICLGLFAVGSAAGGAANGAVLLLSSRLLESIAFVGLTVAGPKLIAAAIRPADHGPAFALWSTYMPTGMALSMIAAPLLLQNVGWRGLWYGNAAAALACLCLLLWALRPRRWPDAPARAHHVDWTGIAATLRRPGPWLLGICFALYSIQFFAVMTWLPSFLVETQGRALGAAALFTAFVVLSNAAGNLSAGWLMQRGVPVWSLIAGAYIVMAASAFGIFADIVPADFKLVLAFTFSGIGGLLPAAILAAAPAHAPSPGQIALASGFVVQGANTGGLIGPPALAAVVTGLGGWESGYWLMLACGGLGLLAALYLAKFERRR